MKAIDIEVNGTTIEARDGEMLLAALGRAGFKVPTLCHLKDLTPSGACRMCVVEVDGRPGLVPSCAYPVAAGMKVQTHSPRVVRARKTIVELLLANHPDDCLYCVRSSNCELQSLAAELGVRERRYVGGRSHGNLDTSGASVIRDPDKCILCGRCVRVCEEIQAVAAIDFVGRGSQTQVGTAFDGALNVSSCVNCGQCIMVCPTGALREQSSLKRVQDALNNPELTVVVQHAPAVSVSLAEEFGLKSGLDINGKMVAALRRIGFARVFDTSFAADLTIMEEVSELIQRVTTGGVLPMMTSCSPAWIRYVEEFQPDFIDNLSSCKSPQQMLGAVLKSYYADREKLDPSRVFSVAIMPCTAKKFESQRQEMGHNNLPDIDAVLTTRELARLLRMRGIDLDGLPAEVADSPFGQRSSAGKIFGATGGVMEAAVRTLHYMLTGTELDALELQPVRGLEGVKEATLRVGQHTFNVAVASGLGNAKKLLDEIRSGLRTVHFLEVMSCPGGCIAGGGQPLATDPERVKQRMQALYGLDRKASLRTSHHNPDVQSLYRDFLGAPLSETSHHLLHTHYCKKDNLNQA